MALAGTLVLMARAQAAVGAASSNVDALEAAVTAGRAAAQLMAMGGAWLPAAVSVLPYLWLLYQRLGGGLPVGCW